MKFYLDNYLIKVESNGEVTWQFPDILRSYCRVDIKYFPFDKYLIHIYTYFTYLIYLIIIILRQKCKLELQSWSRGMSEIIVKSDDEMAYSNYSFIQTEWHLLKIENRTDNDNGFIWLEYTVYLRRNHAFFGILI